MIVNIINNKKKAISKDIAFYTKKEIVFTISQWHELKI